MKKLLALLAPVVALLLVVALVLAVMFIPVMAASAILWLLYKYAVAPVLHTPQVGYWFVFAMLYAISVASGILGKLAGKSE